MKKIHLKNTYITTVIRGQVFLIFFVRPWERVVDFVASQTFLKFKNSDISILAWCKKHVMILDTTELDWRVQRSQVSDLEKLNSKGTNFSHIKRWSCGKTVLPINKSLLQFILFYCKFHTCLMFQQELQYFITVIDNKYGKYFFCSYFLLFY